SHLSHCGRISWEPFAPLWPYALVTEKKGPDAVTEEDRWICGAQAGDHDAFRQLWEAHHAVVMAVALRLCHHRGIAEEITQGAFVLAWQNLARFKQGWPFRPWLLRLAYRHALDV